MPEGVGAYPRWQGTLRGGPSFVVIAGQEIRRAWNNQWSRTAIMLVLAYTVVYLGSLFTLSQNQGDRVHTKDNLLSFLNLLRWGALGVAAVMAGPSLLEDSRRGALELYLSRAVTRTDYLLGKILAILGLSTLSLFLPAVLYYLAGFLFFENQPEGWNLIPAQALLYALMWAALITGLGMGLSCVARSSRAATILLFGGFAALDVLITQLLESITRNGQLQILSPFSALAQQSEWLFQNPGPFQFPAWWGLVHWGLLTAVGWGLVIWRHPRVAGEERGS